MHKNLQYNRYADGSSPSLRRIGMLTGHPLNERYVVRVDPRPDSIASTRTNNGNTMLLQRQNCPHHHHACESDLYSSTHYYVNIHTINQDRPQSHTTKHYYTISYDKIGTYCCCRVYAGSYDMSIYNRIQNFVYWAESGRSIIRYSKQLRVHSVLATESIILFLVNPAEVSYEYCSTPWVVRTITTEINQSSLGQAHQLTASWLKMLSFVSIIVYIGQDVVAIEL